jgi:hypothetical protein
MTSIEILNLITAHEKHFNAEMAMADAKPLLADWIYHWKRASYHAGILAELRHRMWRTLIIENGSST